MSARGGGAKALVMATRLAGTDGVSLESDKLAASLRRRGWTTLEVAGELDGPGVVIPEMHFLDPVAQALGDRCFGELNGTPPDGAAALAADVRDRADELLASLRPIVADERPDLLVIQNACAIPMQLPLGLALADLVAETALPTLSHEHDYWWERERFRQPRLLALLDLAFPFDAAHVVHLQIQHPGRHRVGRAAGHPGALAPERHGLPRALRGPRRLQRRLSRRHRPGRRSALQPTRVVPRKGIELALDLLHGLGDPRDALVVTHEAGDEGLDYLTHLERRAASLHVDLRHVADHVGETRLETAGGKRYAFADAYAHAALVTYPSLYEGFGNALLETIAARRPGLVNRYPVYARDLAPAGFRFVEIEGRVDDTAVEAVSELLADPARVERDVDHNHTVARERFGLDRLERVLDQALADLGVSA